MKFLNNLTTLFLLLSLASCLGTKHLNENQLLLVEQDIKGNETIPTGELEDFYRQQPNLQFPLIPWAPYVSLYYLGENFYDKEKIRRKRDELAERYDERIAEAEEEGRDTRAQRLREKKRDKIEKRNKVLEEGNLLMRTGEPIAVYDSSLTRQTAQQMERYLHAKGFFHGEVDYRVEADDKKAEVTYLVEENTPFTIDTASLTVTNNNIRQLILNNKEESYIDTTQRYDQAELAKERDRIDNLLKNHGYYDFSPQYVHFDVDTTLGNYKVAVETLIYQPSERGYHKQFKIDSVIFITDATTRGDLAGRNSRLYNGIIYRFFEENYSKKVLDNRVFLRPDSLYSRESTLETQKQLANLDIFKFINVSYDTTGEQFNAMIYTSPLKKFQTSTELGATYSQGIPGPLFNATLTNRNPFGGLEILQLNVQAGVEGVPGTINPGIGYKSTQIGANLSLQFPQFIAPVGPRLRNRLGRLNPRTRLMAGVAYLERPEFIRTNANTSLTYNWQTERERKDNVYSTLYSVAPVSISVIDSEFKLGEENEEGRAYLDSLRSWAARGNPLIRSFDDAFVSSMYAYAVFTKNNYGSYVETKNSRYIRPYIESGGTTQNLVDFPFTTEDSVRESGNLRGFRFLKFSNDYRKYIPLGEKTALAYRINAGVAIPYGSENATLPYEKFFFAGGSNSIRSYRPRRLGPGVYTPPSPDGDNWEEDEIIYNAIEQPGEVLLEGSVEYRHNIFGFLNGAVFLDFGNTWRLDESEATPGGEFRIDEFYKQIALGGGYGLRLDFSFLIIRFDFGVKLFNPMAVTRGEDGDYNYSEGWTFDKFSGFPFKDDLVILNIGIGYPF